ncbi:hypothetical protein shim_35790 [Shimia sp. SK013]|uniref:SRPBCC domain-containing protein n=1 Tax=Shimia sp. SK013 TaxID=1389006 RepID=UPI0006B4370B|nr:SRPBCC domain-containing protein [Shimia sp. SK013]KPA20081.1 hypothetical protein shim_35790 [Shimia sp. SK013]
MTDPIVKTVVVKCGAAKAFDVFARETSRWWPLDNHSVSAGSGKAALAITIEPDVGGAVYETMHDGTRTDWGRVLEYVPGDRLTITWHPGSGADTSTRVSVVFEDQGAGECRVTLTHSGWESWKDKAEDMRGNYNKGWDIVFGERFVACAK